MKEFRVWTGVAWAHEIFIGEMVSPCSYGWIGDLVYQQFTGFKDKNGAKIFEGDWVEFSKPSLFGNLTWVELVAWNSLKGMWSLIHFDGLESETHPLYSCDFKIAKVVTNNCENPKYGID